MAKVGFSESINTPLAKSYHCKDPRTKHKYNLFSRLFFCWIDPLFWIGCRRDLKQNDLYLHPSEADSEKLLHKFNRYWRIELERKILGLKPRLSLVILKCFWWRFLLHGLTTVVEVTLLVSQSVVLGLLVGYFSIQEPTDVDTRNAYLYSSGLILLALLILLFHGHAFHLGTYIGMLTRICMTSAIYQKVLSLNQMAIRSISIGHVVNLASNDVQRFDMALRFTPYFYVAPIHTAIVTYLTYLELGWRAFLIIGFLVVLLPLQVFLGRLFTHLRFKSILVTDKRVRIMHEIISGIRVIKMYAWEHAFKRLITKLRQKESIIILQGGLIRASGFGLTVISLTLLMFLLFSVFATTGGELTPRNLFTTLSLLIVLRLSSVDYVVQNILSMSELQVAVTRLQRLLEMNQMNEGNDDTDDGSVCVKVNNVSASWDEKSDCKKMNLSDISFEVSPKYSLLLIVGQVGAGKSSLLQCLLGELKPQLGSVSIKGRVSYASQEAWVFSGTLRDNILFGQSYDPAWYQLVVEACALDKDIKQLADGDLTLIGERGATLSGGQKARVNLARAVYHDADIFILDDPLSAVDVEVARHIFNKCIRELLCDHLVILVTHQVQFAQQASRILALKEGHVEVYGTQSELFANGVNSKDVLLDLVRHPEDEREQFSVVDHENAVSYIPSTPSLTSITTLAISKPCHDHEEFALHLSEDKTQGTISFGTYFHYFRAGASVLVLLLMMSVFIMGEGGIVLADWWLSDWAICSQFNISKSLQLQKNSSASLTCLLTTTERICVYVGTCVVATVLSFARTILFYFICVNASRVLHNRMLSTIFRAPVHFFDTNPIGCVLNRFSKDVGFLDDLLPPVFTEYFLFSWRVTAIIFIAVASSVWVLIPAVVLVLGFIVLRAYFLKTAREVKRLEAIARSPVYSHLSVTLQGLATIRALKKEVTALKLFHKYHNEHTQGWYLYIATSRWFGLRIDLLSAAFLALVAFSSILLSSTLNPALVGLVLTYVVSLTDTLQYSIRMSTEVENTMVSAERVMDYCKLVPEASVETLPPNHSPPASWPDKGQITMKNVSFQYSPQLPFVLKDLCFNIQPREKIGVIGRTGAGKSSLISVLYRLAEPCGLITIDDVDIKTIGLHNLRKKISIIPQDPVLFNGTVHYNLDPFDEYTDADLWDALEQVQLKPIVQQLEGQLNGEVSEGGANFSVGQRQLMCLARALLKENKILILDEATANVDMKTDEIIQETIREKFSKCTVITIAHRLNTVMDSDRIMVMSQGQLREFGTPYDLLHDHNSLLHNMVEKTGPAASRKLWQMAIDVHLGREKSHKDAAP